LYLCQIHSMKKLAVLAACLFLTVSALDAQTAADSVKATIDKMFLAMKNSDANGLKECFSDSAILQTIARDRTGGSIVKKEVVADFAKVISTMPKGAADERITYDVVKVDGPLAIVWAPYKFYLNGQFSHCGVNSFQLVRFGNGWKIQYLVDTRRKQPCE
ncbi:MAG: hypothetical protein JWQ78_1193, partial [Sediminibacterium sp.]|nr:hypothetical protein [Sediminibacterium sp.]